ncbi:sigma-70 family RNA polymerase sigma factor [Ramlibacter rhizophilus]|uniref:RNA polymerase sigma factor n=1 Tax=Ramlibacter rhizophilus TaxID=1781167 RepID=A0A4Z0BTH6_9BURK|nr:sigma-70 family RNA polymerase sigma factor [Ramlibacter rhizophilus]TFZ01309.1 sigma-70 family RNA polymerase sigma factor [Ramlibacter rhizophilus]
MESDTHERHLIELIECVARQADTPQARRAGEAAFRTLYELTAPRLHGLALRVVGNREWAEDVLQDAFLYVWRTARDYSASLSPPMAWLGLVVRSRALDFLRRRGSQRVDASVPLDEALEGTLPMEQPSPLDASQASESAWALHECLRKLEARQREVLSLAYLRDLSQSELATQLRLPLGTVKSWIRRGIDQLRQCMAHFA